MNKFEALSQFQSWPPEWQRLCAECWIEMGDVDPKFVLAFPKQEDKTPPEPVSTMTKDVFPCLHRPKAAKVAFTQECAPIYRGEFGIIEREYLAKCHEETNTRRDAANMFLDRYPGRSVQAVEIKIRKMLDASGVMHVRY